ncbi:autotransporter outer membrane beta-barrel domain-containing protein [Campylobacter coli]|uniref:Autotransporter outer membrane beta-barrel domain-containing protein n=1 Tax=Campylobacter jejuni TaxID=197 RepID=A0A6C7USK5_CAMJU|nr:autotransporter outer membrane beta-barrel domain-containing protein [Campylobacter coli]
MKKYLLMLCAFECVFASVVNPDFSYQDYLDFASNKGKFKVGATNIQIISKQGKVVDLNAPMIDFGAANFSGRLKGEYTNIGQSFAVGAAHMTWRDKLNDSKITPFMRGETLYFAGVASRAVAASNDFRSRKPYDIDFAVLKMQKLNLNISASISKELDFIEKVRNDEEESLRYEDKYQKTLDFSQGKGKLYNQDRYEYFVREGTGIQGVGDIDITKRPTKVSDADKYHIGGFVTLGDKNDIRSRFLLSFNNYNNQLKRNDFTSSSAPGDSGSALYVYDKLDKKWYLIGVISKSDCNAKFSAGYNCTLVHYALINQPLIDEFKGLKSIKLEDGSYVFENRTLKHDNKEIKNVEFISEKNSGHILFNDGGRIIYEERVKEMEKSKDLYFAKSGTIEFKSDTDLGAGVLNFAAGSKWEISGNHWFIGGGIYTDAGSKVVYNAKLKKDDFLHKMGQGELEIQSNNIDSGLRMGEGLVSLTGQDKQFGEIYVNGGVLKISHAKNIDFNTLYLNGGTLDLNGQKLSTDQIKANSNKVFITSSKENGELNFVKSNNYIYHGNFISNNNFGLNIKNSQIIFDGNIYNAKSTMKIDNSKVDFQGHPIIHAYVDENTLKNLANIGQSAFTKGVNITQDDWETRHYNLKEIDLDHSYLNLSSYANLQVQDLNAKDSSVILGSKEISIDEKDTENIFDRDVGEDYGYITYTGIGKEMFYTQNIKNTNNSEVKEVYFKGNLNLDNSYASIYKTNFEGSIKALENEKMVSLNQSKFKGNIKAKNLYLHDNTISGNVYAENLNAVDNVFHLDITTQDNITSTQSTQGRNNSILFKLGESSQNRILVASLADEKKEITDKYFSFSAFNQAFSKFVPNVKFAHDGKKAEWTLIKTGDSKPIKPDMQPGNKPEEPTLDNSFFYVEDNKQALDTANSLANHFVLNYIAEWNNMQKRMGELRDNPYAYGFWLRSFGGRLSDQNSNGNYFEIQAGLDKQSEFSNFNLYSGLMLNYTQTKLNSSSLDIKSKGYGLGQYLSFLFQNDLYLDFVLRYVRYQNDMSASFLPNVNLPLNTGISNNIITSLELGYRKYLQNFYLEPQIEFISGYVDNIHLRNQNVDIKLDSYIPLVLKSTLFIGANNIKDTKLNLRAGLGYMGDLKKSGQKTFTDNLGTRHFDGLKDDRIFINLNTSYEINRNTRLSLDFEKSFLGDLNIDWSMNANLRYSF